MQLYTLCKACETEIHVKPRELTRSDLERVIGEYFRVNCQNCAKNQEIHVNDVIAKPNVVIIVIGGVLGSILALIFMFYFGLISGALFIIPLIIWQQQKASAGTFNSYRVKKTKK